MCTHVVPCVPQVLLVSSQGEGALHYPITSLMNFRLIKDTIDIVGVDKFVDQNIALYVSFLLSDFNAVLDLCTEMPRWATCHDLTSFYHILRVVDTLQMANCGLKKTLFTKIARRCFCSAYADEITAPKKNEEGELVSETSYEFTYDTYTWLLDGLAGVFDMEARLVDGIITLCPLICAVSGPYGILHNTTTHTKIWGIEAFSFTAGHMNHRGLWRCLAWFSRQMGIDEFRVIACELTQVVLSELANTRFAKLVLSSCDLTTGSLVLLQTWDAPLRCHLTYLEITCTRLRPLDLAAITNIKLKTLDVSGSLPISGVDILRGSNFLLFLDTLIISGNVLMQADILALKSSALRKLVMSSCTLPTGGISCFGDTDGILANTLVHLDMSWCCVGIDSIIALSNTKVCSLDLSSCGLQASSLYALVPQRSTLRYTLRQITFKNNYISHAEVEVFAKCVPDVKIVC